jgi:membrane-associated phospholipid phosphatase
MTVKDLSFVFAQSSPIFIPVYAILYGLTSVNYYMVLYGIFACINILLNFIIKQIIKFIYNKLGVKTLPLLGTGIRPKGAFNCGLTQSNIKQVSHTFGMPSGHSQSAWFLFGFMLLYLLDTMKHIDNNNSPKTPLINSVKKPWTAITILLLLGLCVFISVSRVYVGCHTIQQVVVGGILGFMFGTLSYLLVKRIVEKKSLKL